jgi:effector-binding domain-containing protein
VAAEIELKQLPAQLALVVHTPPGTLDTSMERMWDAVAVLTRHIEATGAQVVGPAIEYYPEPLEGEYSFALGWPVAPGAVPGVDVALEELPAVEAVTLLVKGPYEGIWPAWERVKEWVTANRRRPLDRRRPGGAPREVYHNDPREVEEAELLTELVLPLAPLA